MKRIEFILCFFLGLSFVFFSCTPSEPEVFEGIWIEKRNPECSWEIKRKGGNFVGIRLSGEDKYDYDTETWKIGKEGKFQDPNKSISILNPLKEGGSKITYMKGQDMILRLPPGTTYIRKK